VSDKRIRAWICPFCDGTILAPESLAVHIERKHPEHGIEPRDLNAADPTDPETHMEEPT
jgi:hypothetical protein